MSVSCNTFPTLTSTNVITSESLLVTSTASITTSPPTTITTTTLICATPATGTSTCIPTPTPVIITSPGGVATVQVPITVSVEVTTTQFETLFGTSCTTINNNNNKPDDPTPSPPTPSPPPITNTSSSTLPNGSVSIVTTTETSTQPPGQQTSVQSTNNTDNKTNLAPIIGGVVGGFFGLIAIVALIWFILKRRRRWDDIFDKEDEITFPPTGPARKGRNDRFSLDVDVEPKPYQYGLVGHAVAPGPVSPPNSPPMLPSVPTGTESQISHGRHNSLTPLNVPMTTSAPGLSPGLSVTTISSRPSTGGSTQPLRPPSQQGYFPVQPQPQPRSADAGRATSTAHSHTQSVASSVYSGTHAIGMNMAMGSDDHTYFNRSGSPMSMQEQQMRILQVANAPPVSSPVSDTFPYTDPAPSSSSPGTVVHEATASAVPQRDGKGRLRTSTAKVPLVHLDGGRVQQELEGTSSSSGAGPSGASPPAYEA